MIYSVYMVNRAGSLLYHRDFAAIKKLDTNERLRLSGLLHGMSAFAGQLSPTSDSSGIVEIVADTFRLRRFRTPTGMQLIVIADPKHTGSLDSFLRKVYQIYADYALKNPFYAMDMPIRADLFDEHLAAAVETASKQPS